MPTTKLSPTITRLSWGRLEADGQTFKDAKLYPSWLGLLFLSGQFAIWGWTG